MCFCKVAFLSNVKCEFSYALSNVLMKIVCHPYSIDWSAVVVDEAHKIKNANSQITQAMKNLKCEVRTNK